MNPEQLSGQASRRPETAGALGKIIAVSGSRATIGILPGAENARTTVSKFVLIHSCKSRLIAVVTEVSLNVPPAAKEQGSISRRPERSVAARST